MVRRDGAAGGLVLSLPAPPVLPHFAALQIRRISPTAIEMSVYENSGSRSSDPEVVGSNATSAFSTKCNPSQSRERSSVLRILRTPPFLPRAEERDAAGEERADKEDERDAAVDQSRAARPREDSHEDQQEEEY